MEMGFVKNWAEFQHYKDRSPPWIKLHRGLLDNIDYALLDPVAAKCLPLIWLIASEYDGHVPEIDILAFRLRLSVEAAQAVVDDLLKRRFLGAGSSEQVATPAQHKSNPSRYVPDKTRMEVFQRDGGACVWCGSQENVEFDHVTPVSKGGKSTACNLQLLCRSCNRKKRTREAEQAEQVATQQKNLRSLEGETETEREGEKAGRKRPSAPRAQGEITLPDWIDSLDGAMPVPGDDPLFAWAAKQGMPADWIALAYAAFEDRYSDNGKTYADWRAAFRNHVKRGWLDIWRLDARTGNYVLTTAGEQYRREVTA